MHPSAKFWDRLAERYAKQPVADEAAYQTKLQVTRQYFRPDMEVLEFGCGTGSTAIAHAPFVRHILAIDISSKMIDIARAKATAENVQNVTFECSTMETLNAPDPKFDAVLALNILHLVDSMEMVVRRVHGMLRPGGIFVTSTPCLGDSLGFFRFVAPIGLFLGQSLGLMPLVKVFTNGELVASLAAAGFEIDYQWQPGPNKSVFIVAKKSTQ